MEDQWIVTLEASKDTLDEAIKSGPSRIHRVPELLVKNPSNKKHFVPEVVALGPYHHCTTRNCSSPYLKEMEEHKKASTVTFTVLRIKKSVSEVFGEVKGVIHECRDRYAESFSYSDHEFAQMMFVDSCFVLHFIHLYVSRKLKELTIGSHLHAFILRDIFLLENQIPYPILEKLLTLFEPKLDLEAFIDMMIGASPSRKSWRDTSVDPIHLLDLLHTRLLGPSESSRSGGHHGFLNNEGFEWRSFRTVMELKGAGISIRRIDSHYLSDIKFHHGFSIYGHLTLPPFVVDELTRPRLLNLIALEMCPGKSTTSTNTSSVTSYVCFLDMLIDDADDVKELRSKEVLFNALGSDQDVAGIFNEIATDLAPDHDAYSPVIEGINRYYRNKSRVSLVLMMNAHFSTPWSTISFVAASVLLVLTFVQTIFSIKN